MRNYRNGGVLRKKFKHQLQECRYWLRKLRSRRDANGIWRYNQVRWEYLHLLDKQEIYWRQRAKQHWLREGDRNTRFFHRYASTRKKNNKVEKIKNAEGEWQVTTEGVRKVIEEYFGELFKAVNGDGKLSDQEIVQ